MLPATGSMMIAATWPGLASSTRSKASASLKGTVRVSRTVPSGTPPEPGMPSVAAPEPAATSSMSAWP